MDKLLQSLIGPGSPFELQAEEGGLKTFRHAPRTLRDLYARVRKRPQETPVLVTDGVSVTLAELFKAAGVIASKCHPQCGDGRGPRRVAIVLPNGPEFVASLIAITDSGWVAVLVPYDTDVHNLLIYVDVAECDLVVTTEEISGVLATRVKCPCQPVSWSGLVAPGSDAGMLYALEALPEGEAVVAFTSGSSGKPKAVVTSHRALVTGLWNMMLTGAWTAKRNRLLEGTQAARSAGGSPCSLLVAPLSHVNGYAHVLLSLVMSSRVVLMSRWDPGVAADLACRHDVRSVVGATPRMILDLLDVPLHRDQVLPIESFGVHGAALRRGLTEEIRKRIACVRFSTGYGLTETNGSIASTAGTELISMPGTCGPVLPTVDIEIVDEFGHVRATGEPGEIRVRGAMLFDKYHQRESNSVRVTATQWFETGDIGFLDENRFLFLLERGSDTIRAGSDRVFCSDIEKYLDDAHWGDEIVAMGFQDGAHLLVGIVSRRSHLDLDELKRQLVQNFRVAEESITVVCGPELPRTRSGKIDRRALAASILQQAI